MISKVFVWNRGFVVRNVRFQNPKEDLVWFWEEFGAVVNVQRLPSALRSKMAIGG